MVMKPSTSNRRPGCPGNAGNTSAAATAARIPTGTLTKKINRQSVYSTR
jgi:hypothetical protein